MIKYGETGLTGMPDELFWASVYKAICNIKNAPKPIVDQAKSWLAEKGYHTTIM